MNKRILVVEIFREKFSDNCIERAQFAQGAAAQGLAGTAGDGEECHSGAGGRVVGTTEGAAMDFFLILPFLSYFK